MTVRLPGFLDETQSMKIRLLPGELVLVIN